MVLVLIFLIMAIVIFILIILATTMFAELEITNFKLYKEHKQKTKINKNYKAIIYFYILKHTKVLKLNINTNRLKSYYNKKKGKKNIVFILLKSTFLESSKIDNKKNIEIKKLNLNLKIGTENIFLTSGAVTIFNTIVPIFLSKYIEEYNKKLYEYKIMPVYYNKNVLDLFIDCKIRIKLADMLNIVRKYLKSRKELIQK